MELSDEELTFRFSAAVQRAFQEVYENGWINALRALMMPTKRYFLRVNTLKADVEDVIETLASRGYKFKQLNYIEEAIYMNIEAGEELPRPDKFIVADRWAAENVLQGANLYIPGVLKYPPDLEKGDIIGVTDDDGLLVGVGVAEVSAIELRRKRKGVAVRMTHPVFKAPSTAELPEWKAGLVYPQSLPSIIASRVFDPQPGEVIVDMCAAPGGKLTHIAALTNDRAKIYGFDKSGRKVNALRELLKRMGIRNVIVAKMDTRYIDLKLPQLEADRVIIDPPCSALGVRPKLAANYTREELANFYTYQIQFLMPASKILRRGGILLFSVCTITKQEIEGIAEYATSNLPFELADQEIFTGSTGIDRYSNCRCIQRFHPHIHDTPGFGIILLRKI